MFRTSSGTINYIIYPRNERSKKRPPAVPSLFYSSLLNYSAQYRLYDGSRFRLCDFTASLPWCILTPSSFRRDWNSDALCLGLYIGAIAGSIFLEFYFQYPLIYIYLDTFRAAIKYHNTSQLNQVDTAAIYAIESPLHR